MDVVKRRLAALSATPAKDLSLEKICAYAFEGP